MRNPSGPAATEPQPPTCERLWTVRDAAEFLGVPVATLHQWRYLGTGPDAYRVGRHLRYDPVVVQAWLDSSCRRTG